jgi:hypothetical protein
MANFSSLQGEGSVKIYRDPVSLGVDLAEVHRPPRVRFTLNPSGTETPTTSRVPLNELERTKDERQTPLDTERVASIPYLQFRYETSEEGKLLQLHEKRTQSLSPLREDIYELSVRNVKTRWTEQGIWNNKWGYLANGRWKHEEPLELESESETDTEEESPPQPSLFGPRRSIFDSPLQQPQPKPKRPKSDYERQQIAEQRVVKERQREASRPYHRFVHQVSEERERIEDESRHGIECSVRAADINTRAYGNVKEVWIKRGLWNTRWGILPGMSWKHEEPLEEVHTEPNHCQESGAMKAEAARAYLRPIHSSQVSKAASNKSDRSQSRADVSQMISAAAKSVVELQPLSGQVTPRRSKRIQSLTSSVSEDSIKGVFKDPSKGAARSKSKRNVIPTQSTISSAKPRGISKKRSAKTTQRKPRKV